MKTEQILGIRFLNGTAVEAVAHVSEKGGLLVAPSGTCFERFLEDNDYRRAIGTADLVLPDSGLMVALWRLRSGAKIKRISGLAYLKQLLREIASQDDPRLCWVLPHDRARVRLLSWGKAQGLLIDAGDCYVAPIYEPVVKDETLIAMLESRKPRHVVIAIGAGAQEKLGWQLRERLSFRPAIHCIGGALGFLTGDQVAIPDWADRLYLGWFLRLVRQPRVFVPRLWKAHVLPGLLFQYGSKLPPSRRTGA